VEPALLFSLTWPVDDMNIVLVGYRCSGKTTVGKALAEKLGRVFVDTDEVIQQDAGSTIEEMVSKKGWECFREIEKRVIQEVSGMDLLVIATGGGALMDQENVRNLKENGWIVWLKADAHVLHKRMKRDEKRGKTRPSLTGADSLQEIEQVLAGRLPFYEGAGDFTVEADRLSIPQAAALIMENLPDPCKRGTM